MGFRDCIWFAANGLSKAGIGPGSHTLSVPNYVFFFYRLVSDKSVTGSKDPEKDKKPPHERKLIPRDKGQGTDED